MELSLVLTDDLARNCAAESSKKQSASRNDRFCFELARRAFGLEDDTALGHVLNIYKDIWSRFWIRSAHTFETQVLTSDDFKSIAFVRVYQQIKGSAFDGFSSLTPLLAYMRVTLARTVAEYLRSSAARQSLVQMQREDDDLTDVIENIAAPENPRTDSEKNLIRQDVDKRLAHLLPDENDRLLFDCWARQDLSRAQIAAAYPHIWKTEDAVRVALQRIRRRFYNDPLLTDLLAGLL